MTVLTAIDVTGVQAFVFASSRLVDIAASSAAVNELVGRKHLDQVVGKNGGRVLYAAGANALLDHPNLDAACTTVRELSRRVLAAAPELGFVVEHRDRGLASSFADLSGALARRKASDPPSGRLTGLGFTAVCDDSALPAEALASLGGGPKVPITGSLLRRRRAFQRAARADSDEPIEPVDLDVLSGGGERAEIAVVHVDGTGLGVAINQALEERDDWVAALCDISDDITLAFDIAVETLREACRPWVSSGYLPYRVVARGGDDLTFACRADLAVPLTRRVLAALKTYALAADWGQADWTEGIPAGAGVAIAPASTPMWALVEQAELLTASAKAIADGSRWAYDWHIGLAGDDVLGLRADLAEEDPHGTPLTLFARPYGLGSTSDKVLQAFLDPTTGIGSPDWEQRSTALRRIRNTAMRSRTVGVDMTEMEQELRRAGEDPVSPLWSHATIGPLAGRLGWTDDRFVFGDAFEMRERWADL